MQLLVINYGTAQLERLRDICSRHHVTVADGEAFTGLVDNNLDGVLVIGDMTDDSHQAAGRQAAIDLMQTGDMPVFAMGLGFALLCAALKADLDQLAEKDLAAGKLIPTDDGAKIFQGSDPILVRENERWCLDELPRGIAVLARSETGIEAIRSKSRPLFAMQQLPDDFVYASDGKLVVENFISSLTKK
jgi:anthranilate/para-aminobenzoate synthase component II